MRTSVNLALATAVLLLCGPAPQLHAQPADDGAAASLAATPPGPALDALQAVHRLVAVRRFALAVPYEYEWSAESLQVRTGYVLVLEVAPEFCRPLQTGGAVLYVGPRPAEIVNGDNDAGTVIALVPGEIDFAEVPIFYGSTVLPERVDAARGREELAAARALGVSSIGATERIAAIAAGGAILDLGDVDDLYRALAEVVAEYSPEETDLIRTLRLIP